MRKYESLTYENEIGESVVFSHFSIFCMQNVTGLSDVRSSVYSINSLGQSGDTFISSRIESRDIDISGVIREQHPDEARTYRRMLARIMNPQFAATLTYTYGMFTRVIACRAVNSPTVSKQPKGIYPAFTITLNCPNPFWRDTTESRSDIAAWIGAFEFPVEIPTIELGGMELGYRMPSLIVNVINGGDVSTGMRIQFSALEAVKNPSIMNLTTGEMLRLNVDLDEGDILTVSTAYGEKWATLNHNGIERDALRYVDVDSAFLLLMPGENSIRYDAEDGLSNLEVTIYHSNLYLGV